MRKYTVVFLRFGDDSFSRPAFSIANRPFTRPVTFVNRRNISSLHLGTIHSIICRTH